MLECLRDQRLQVAPSATGANPIDQRRHRGIQWKFRAFTAGPITDLDDAVRQALWPDRHPNGDTDELVIGELHAWPDISIVIDNLDTGLAL